MSFFESSKIIDKISFQVKPATDVYIEVQSRQVEIYSASLLIYAQFSGLRHLMFNWPILSASVGISSNLFFLGVICALSWFHLTRSKEDETGDLADFDLFQGDLDGNLKVGFVATLLK